MDPGVLPSGPPVAFTPDPLLASACAGAQSFRPPTWQHTRFADEAAAREGLAATWIRCLDHVPSSHAGLQLLPDGRWRSLALEGGELVAGSGFGREGQLTFSGTITLEPGYFQVNLWPFGRLGDAPSPYSDGFSTPAWERALVFSSLIDGWPEAVYLPTDLPVRASEPLYGDGERAGVAACASGEQGLVSTLEEAASQLDGDYVLCSGSHSDGAALLRFAAGRVELHGADGSLIDAGAYEINHINQPTLSLGITFERLGYRFWTLVASRQPLKLQLIEGGNFPNVSVFSALPRGVTRPSALARRSLRGSPSR